MKKSNHMVRNSTYALLLMIMHLAVQAQNNYSTTNFRAGISDWTDISTTGTAISMTNAENGVSATPINIGFTFQFNGTNFTQFMIHEDGILRFGTSAPGASTVITTSSVNSYSTVFTSTAPEFQNVILPFFTNLVQGTNPPEFHVLTTGTSPNRICTIQWKNLRDADHTGTTGQNQFANVEFQVKLYETTNDIEFIYGSFMPSGANPSARQAATGIKASSSSFCALARLRSVIPFQKVSVFTPANASRDIANSPFRNTVIPPHGFSQRFFGRIASDINTAKIYTDSIITAGVQSTGIYQALIVNEGTSAASNINVTLSITGTNTQTSTVNIASIAAGSSQTVQFSGITLGSKGQQQVLVTATSAGDTRAANNALTMNQVVSQSQKQTFDFSYLSGPGVGYNNLANQITGYKIFGSGTRKIKQVRIPFNSYRNIVNVRIYEDGGTGGAPSNSPLFTSSNFLTTSDQSFMIYTFENAVTVTGDYYVAVQQTTTTNMQWRVAFNTPITTRWYNGTTTGSWFIQDLNSPWQQMVDVYEESSTADVGIERISSPGCDYNANADVKVMLRNYSSVPVDFSASPVQITGSVANPSGVTLPISVLKNSGILAAGAAEEITISTGYDFTARGTHRFLARTALAGDAEPGNDSLFFTITNNMQLTSSATGPICPLTSVNINGVSFLGNPQFTIDGQTFSGTTRTFSPLTTTVVKFSGVDYRGCTLTDSIIVQVISSGLPPKPVLLYGDTILSHRRNFRDTVRVQRLPGHTIEWFTTASGTNLADSAFILDRISSMSGARLSAGYRSTSGGCISLSDTLRYQYITGVLHNDPGVPLAILDTAFYDQGGPVGIAGATRTRTYTPAIPGTKVRLVFYRTDLRDPSESISIFDGTNTSAPFLKSITQQDNGNTIQEFIASNESGALTIRLTGFSFTGSGIFSEGWWAGLNCHTPEVYRTVTDGDWNTPSIWERRSPGGDFIPATRNPIRGDDTLFIRHNLSLITTTTNTLTYDQIIVEKNATLHLVNPTPTNLTSLNLFKSTTQAELTVKGTLNIDPSVRIIGTNGQMNVEGRLNNLGRIELDTVFFQGNEPQILGSSSSLSGEMRFLKLNNPAGLTMGGDQSVMNVFFQNGILYSSSENTLTITEQSSAPNGASNNSYLSGPVDFLMDGANTRLLPLGSNGKYRPVSLIFFPIISYPRHTLKAEIIEGAPVSRTLPSTISSVSGLRYYRISRTLTGNFNSPRITLPITDDDGVTDPAGLTIAKDNGAGSWIDVGGTVTGGVPGTIQSDLFSGFSDFVLANKVSGLNVFPVTMLSFRVSTLLSDARLEWQTANENQCRSFEVERSRDGIKFTKIGTVDCRNLTSIQNYHYTDLNPGKGRFYYRLKQLDKDGRFEYTVVRKVTFEGNGDIMVYPNPARELIQITHLPNNCDIRMFDGSGRMVLQTRKVQNTAQIKVSQLPSGIYQLQIISEKGIIMTKKVQILR